MSVVAFYKLVDHEAVGCEPNEWAMGLERDEDRRVAHTVIGDSEVSTIFTGIDYSFGRGTPRLFETMVFRGPLGGEQRRCGTWDEAVAMHEEMCRRVSASQAGGDAEGRLN